MSRTIVMDEDELRKLLDEREHLRKQVQELQEAGTRQALELRGRAEAVKPLLEHLRKIRRSYSVQDLFDDELALYIASLESVVKEFAGEPE